MKTSSTLVFAIVAAAVPFVSAHGFVQDLKIDGKLIKGSPVGGKAVDTSIRQVFSQDPIKGANNPSVNCGNGAKAASQVSSANPGSTLAFSWKAADGSNWPHNIGPMLTYMTNCGDEGCDKFDPANAEWFKIQQVGKKDADTWAQNDIKNGADATVTLPKDIAPGNYIVRHEIIALHLANSKGGAEFYEGCVQLKIGGSGTGAPSKDELVKLPGAYSDTDPGIFDPTVFDSGAKYSFPGPAISKLAATSSSSSAPSGNPGTKSQCHLKSSKSKGKRSADYRPRAISRVMRDVIFH